jgi:hypothetical protein
VRHGTSKASEAPRFEPPPHIKNDAGEIRTIGFEVEFGAIDASAAAEVVASLYGGTVSAESEFRIRVENTRLGDFKIKLDTRLVRLERGDGPFKKLETELSNLAGLAASTVIPHEIVTPPLPVDRLEELSSLIPELRRRGASGTEASLFYAFALHINAEAPSLESRSIVAIVKAFVVLGSWLWDSIDPDMTRRLLGFAESFGNDYAARLANPDYWPSRAEMIDDYLTANPSRNRDLDLLPLFAYLDEERVCAKLPDEKINPRPTFHYRLPDARVSDPRWSIAAEWNRWVAVERLAADRARLLEACGAFLRHGSNRKEWAQLVPQLVPA